MPKPIRSPKTELVLLHGTSLQRAEVIKGQQAVHADRPFWVVFQSNRDLAEFFARRTAQRHDSAPAIVSIPIDDGDFARIRQRGDAAYVAFDAADDPFLRGRRQWEITRHGVVELNRVCGEITYELIQ